jgi:hypothetical protein
MLSPTDRYSVVHHQEGGSNVIDLLTGGPVEINGVLLYRIEQEQAEDLCEVLTFQHSQIERKVVELMRRGPGFQAPGV